MTLEQAVYAYLSGFAGLTALVGNRIYPRRLPQDANYPAVTYQRISRLPIRTSGTVPATRSRFQFTCWGADVPGVKSGYDQAKAVAEQVRLALQNYAGLMGGTGGVNVLDATLENEIDIDDGDDTQIGTYQVAVDIFLIHE